MTCVMIGSFAPPTQAQIELIKKNVSGKSDKLILIIGSNNRPRTKELPFSYAERVEFLSQLLPEKVLKNTTFAPSDDYLYNPQLWASSCDRIVSESGGTSTRDTRLIGSLTDKTSYLTMFPQWSFSGDAFLDKHKPAAEVRRALFTDPNSLIDTREAYLLDWKASNMEIYETLREEFEFYENYAKAWEFAPYKPIFHTVDSIVIKSGHILLIRRKTHPGKGLWALPGGFLNPEETCLEAALRELKEETSIKVPMDVLMSSIDNTRGTQFDYPKRSLRGRTITTVFLINLGSGTLPSLKAGDDAAGAFWVPLNTVGLNPSKFFEDHADIITFMVSKY